MTKNKQNDRADRSSLIAGLLSLLLPGLGQVYGGQVYRGVVIFFIEAIAILTTIWYKVPAWYSCGTYGMRQALQNKNRIPPSCPS
jgi:TM2 domain-containing membrane protein YozV